jgi:hypothetical protein
MASSNAMEAPCPELGEMSRPDIIPSEEVSKNLVETAKDRALNVSRKHNLLITNPEHLNDLQNIVLEYKKEKHDEIDWDFILDASAFLEK